MLVILNELDGEIAIEANLITLVEPTESKNPADAGLLHVYHGETVTLIKGDLRAVVADINGHKDRGNTRGVH